MKIVSIGEIEEKRSGFLLSELDMVKQALTVLYDDLYNQNYNEREINQLIAELSRCGSVVTQNLDTKSNPLGSIRAMISTLDKEKKIYLMRIYNFVGANKRYESILADKMGTKLALIGFSLKIKTDITAEGDFIIDVDQLLQPIRTRLPLGKISSVEIASSFMTNYNPRDGKTMPVSLFEQNGVKLSLNFDDAMSERRFDTGCFFAKKLTGHESDTWQMEGSSIRGPFVPSVGDGLNLPTLVFGVEDVKSIFSSGIYFPIVDEKAENSARTLSSIVAAAFLMEK